jgi:hypothetical protein
MEYTVDARQATQALRRIQIAYIRDHVQRTQLSNTLKTAGQPDKFGLTRIALHQSFGHIAKSYNQDFFHCRLSVMPVQI